MLFVGDGDPDFKLYRLFKKYRPSDEMIDKIPFISGACLTHTKQGSIFFSPRKIISTWKITFRDCMMSNNKNVFVSYSFAFATTVLFVIS